MKHATTKTARANRQRSKATATYIAEVGRCQNPECGTSLNLTVHEIKGGESRQNTKMERCAQLVLCATCNAGDFHDRGKWPYARQQALKVLLDPTHVDLVKFSKLCGKGPKWVEGNDVLPHLLDLLIKYPGIVG
jgi:hypothetical protein